MGEGFEPPMICDFDANGDARRGVPTVTQAGGYFSSAK